MEVRSHSKGFKIINEPKFIFYTQEFMFSLADEMRPSGKTRQEGRTNVLLITNPLSQICES